MAAISKSPTIFTLSPSNVLHFGTHRWVTSALFFYRFTMTRLTNAQKQENYRKRKKEAEEGSQRPKNFWKKKKNTNSNTVNFFLYFFRPSLTQAAKTI
jgi:hypothetical protein